MRIGPIPTINKEFSLYTREWERTARLGLEHVLYRIAATVVAAHVPDPEVQKFSRILQASLNVTANIGTNIHGSAYRELADLAYFRHKEILEYCNNKNFQTIVHSGVNYGDRIVKHFHGLVFMLSNMNWINIAVLI